VKRRAFITLLGGVATWPLAARAQQARMRRIGILMAYRPSDPEMQARVQALQQELQRLGWTKGLNIQFDERWTTDDMELVRAHAVNLVELNPDVIVTSGGRVVPIFIQLTRSIPIIIPGVGDPVQTGWVQSLARPGGNVSGFTFFEASVLGKMLEILQQIAPGTSRVAVIYNPDNAANAYALRLTEGFARSLVGLWVSTRYWLHFGGMLNLSARWSRWRREAMQRSSPSRTSRSTKCVSRSRSLRHGFGCLRSIPTGS
jgi:putative tryptophan/tyrosine transport system substrate-binding protein